MSLRSGNLKRLVDCILSAAALAALSPVILALACLVRMRMGSPAFFRQLRIGRGERPFTLIKFRTMTSRRDPEGGLLPDEQRLTHLGHLLRASSLDELPQLWNVLNGDMSLVGPRPLLPEYLRLYTPEQRRRHEVRPGITGWAQIQGRNAITWEEKFKLDIWYVDNECLWLDFRILLLTALKVFRADGISQAGHVTAPRFTGSEESRSAR